MIEFIRTLWQSVVWSWLLMPVLVAAYLLTWGLSLPTAAFYYVAVNWWPCILLCQLSSQIFNASWYPARWLNRHMALMEQTSVQREKVTKALGMGTSVKIYITKYSCEHVLCVGRDGLLFSEAGLSLMTEEVLGHVVRHSSKRLRRGAGVVNMITLINNRGSNRMMQLMDLYIKLVEWLPPKRLTVMFAWLLGVLTQLIIGVDKALLKARVWANGYSERTDSGSLPSEVERQVRDIRITLTPSSHTPLNLFPANSVSPDRE